MWENRQYSNSFRPWLPLCVSIRGSPRLVGQFSLSPPPSSLRKKRQSWSVGFLCIYWPIRDAKGARWTAPCCQLASKCGWSHLPRDACKLMLLLSFPQLVKIELFHLAAMQDVVFIPVLLWSVIMIFKLIEYFIHFLAYFQKERQLIKWKINY